MTGVQAGVALLAVLAAAAACVNAPGPDPTPPPPALDRCGGATDEIEPVPPGIYGPEAAYAVFHGIDDSSLFPGKLLNIIDVTGDGLDDFLLTNYFGPDYVFHTPICPGEHSIEESGGMLLNNFDSAQGNWRGSFLGDLNGDGLGDVRIGGLIYFGPMIGPRSTGSADLRLPWAPTGAVAGEFDGLPGTDLVVAEVSTNDWAGSVTLFSGPILSDADLTAGQRLDAPDGIRWMGDALRMVEGEAGIDTFFVASRPTTQWGSDAGVLAVTGWPGPGQMSPDAWIPLPELEGLRVGAVLDSERSGRACIAGTAAVVGQITAVVCGDAPSLRAGNGTVQLRSLDSMGSLTQGQLSVTTDYMALGLVSWAGGSAQVFGPDPEDVWIVQWPAGNSNFGQGIAISENTGGDYVWLLVSATVEDDNFGNVYAFALEKQ